MSDKTTRTTVSEVNQFNREWEEFEMWRDGVTENIKPPKIKPYYFYIDSPSEPVWFQNLRKAWTSTQRRKALKEAISERDSGVQIPSLDEVRQNPNTWRRYCEKRGLKRKPGRPKLPPEQLKSLKEKVKRSEQMRQLLKDNGINVLDDQSLDKCTDWTFQPNGRVKHRNEPPISVHLFLKNLNAK